MPREDGEEVSKTARKFVWPDCPCPEDDVCDSAKCHRNKAKSWRAAQLASRSTPAQTAPDAPVERFDDGTKDGTEKDGLPEIRVNHPNGYVMLWDWDRARWE